MRAFRFNTLGQLARTRRRVSRFGRLLFPRLAKTQSALPTIEAIVTRGLVTLQKVRVAVARPLPL
jgi:hypothetical protein